MSVVDIQYRYDSNMPIPETAFDRHEVPALCPVITPGYPLHRRLIIEDPSGGKRHSLHTGYERGDLAWSKRKVSHDTDQHA